MAKLGDICTIYSGTGFPVKHQGYLKGKYPFYKVGDIAKNFLQGFVSLSVCDNYIDEAICQEIKGTIIPQNTVVFAKIGEAVKLNRRAITSQPCLIDNNAMGIKPNENIIDLRYFYHFMCNLKLEEYAEATTVPSVKKSVIEKIEIPLPPLETQNQIAANLDKVTHTIELCNTILEKLDLLVKSQFIELFGDPVSNSMGWETEQMNNVAPVVNYTGRFEDEVWLLNLDMVETQTGRIIDYLYVSENEVGNSTCTFDTSNVLYSKLRPYLNKVVIPDRCGYATSELVPLQPITTKLNREYLAYMLRSDFFVNMINEKVAGAKMPRVSMGDFRKFEVPIPPLELQEQFAAFVEQTDKSKSAVKHVLEKAETLKKALMQEYFG